MKILIACSSSGGHINPAISLGKYLTSKNYEVTYLGFKGQLEEKLIDSSKLILLEGKNNFKKSLFHLDFIKILPQLRKIKKNYKFDIYIGFGGFINFFLLFLKGKKPLYIHEQNIILGDTNKVVRLFSKKVFYSFENNDSKGILVGNPSADLVLSKNFNYQKRLNILFVFGSLGSRTLVKKLKEFDGKLDKNHSYTLISSNSKTNSFDYKFNQINVIDYFSLNERINNYDLIVCRGGATTLYEVIKSKINCISIPSPFVKHNHQEKNVDYLANKNLISKLNEKEFTLDNLNLKINDFIDYDYAFSRYQSLSEYIIPNCNKLIEEEINKCLK